MVDGCVLARARGQIVACRHDACPFWEPGGAVLSGTCLLSRTWPNLEDRPDLVEQLEELCETLERPAAAADELAARRALRDLLAREGPPEERAR